LLLLDYYSFISRFNIPPIRARKGSIPTNKIFKLQGILRGPIGMVAIWKKAKFELCSVVFYNILSLFFFDLEFNNKNQFNNK